MKNKLKAIIPILSCLLLLVGYQNCGESFQVNDGYSEDLSIAFANGDEELALTSESTGVDVNDLQKISTCTNPNLSCYRIYQEMEIESIYNYTHSVHGPGIIIRLFKGQQRNLHFPGDYYDEFSISENYKPLVRAKCEDKTKTHCNIFLNANRFKRNQLLKISVTAIGNTGYGNTADKTHLINYSCAAVNSTSYCADEEPVQPIPEIETPEPIKPAPEIQKPVKPSPTTDNDSLKEGVQYIQKGFIGKALKWNGNQVCIVKSENMKGVKEISSEQMTKLRRKHILKIVMRNCDGQITKPTAPISREPEAVKPSPTANTDWLKKGTQYIQKGFIGKALIWNGGNQVCIVKSENMRDVKKVSAEQMTILRRKHILKIVMRNCDGQFTEPSAPVSRDPEPVKPSPTANTDWLKKGTQYIQNGFTSKALIWNGESQVCIVKSEDMRDVKEVSSEKMKTLRSKHLVKMVMQNCSGI